MPIAIAYEPDRQRVVAVVPPHTGWTAFHAAVREQVRRNPHWTAWDWIIDDQGPMDDVEVKEMGDTGALFCRLCTDRLRQTYTVVVSRDRLFWQWALVIDKHYGGRRHLAAPTLEEAHLRLDRLAAGACRDTEPRMTA